MEPEKAVGKALKGARKRRKLSQEKLGFEAGVERNYISLIERGKNSVSIRILCKLCAGLHMRPSELLIQAEKWMYEGNDHSKGNK